MVNNRIEDEDTEDEEGEIALFSLPENDLRNPENGNLKTWLLGLPRGKEYKVSFRTKDDIRLYLSSDDYCIGTKSFGFWNKIAFPYVKATEPCIHGLSAKDVVVSLGPGKGKWINKLTCEWMAGEGTAVSNMPPRSASITGHFPPEQERQISYSLTHPDYVFGETAYFQSARFCPKRPPPSPDDDDLWDSLEEEDEHDKWNDDGTDDDCYDCWCGWCSKRHDGMRCPVHDKPDKNFCLIHFRDYNICSNLHSDVTNDIPFEDVLEMSESKSVLKLRSWKPAVTNFVDVPEGVGGWCCPCPSHHTNYVMKVYSQKVDVRFEDGEKFVSTTEDCNILIRGSSPSYMVGDGVFALAKTGIVYQVNHYTVLGVGMEYCGEDVASKYRDDKQKKYTIYFPARTEDLAPKIQLKTNVYLSKGYVRLRFNDPTAQFKLYKGSRCDETKLLIDTAVSSERVFSIQDWRNICENRDDLEVTVIAVNPGSTELEFLFATDDGHDRISDKVSVKLQALNNPLIADYDRNGSIDDTDRENSLQGKPAYFWVNDDKWKNDDAFVSPIFNRLNVSDDVVNGRHDLLNFLPVAINCTELLERFGNSNVKFHLSGPRGSKFVMAYVPWNDIGKWALGDAVDDCENPAYEAFSINADIGNGVCLSEEFLRHCNNATSMTFFEFSRPVYGEDLWLVVYSEDTSEILFKANLPIHIGDVKDMIAWENLRNETNGSGGRTTCRATPAWPQSERNPGWFVFIHGYNMNEEEDAIPWAVNAFKKLWWSGLDCGFVAVQWHGNEGQISIFDATPNYYSNVQNAFNTASALKTAMDNYPGPKWFMAHSLGNMLVSSAIQDYNMPHEKYFMLNAAVPMEAFDSGEASGEALNNMTPASWLNYAPRLRSTRWHELFPPGDGRHSLTWKRRFENVTNIVNFYSTEEDVVCNGNHSISLIPSRKYAWYKQELKKGDWLLMMHPNEGGWAFNSYYDIVHTITNPKGGTGTYSVHKSPSEANVISNEVLKVKPFFKNFNNRDIYTSPNGLIVSTNYSYRAELLAYAIPSESYAVGANPLQNRACFDLAQIHLIESLGLKNKNNGVKDINDKIGLIDEKGNWYHSTFIQRSYRRTHRLYKMMINIMKGVSQ